MSSIEKKFVLITGCSSGIGHALVARLLVEGYQVIATARSESALAELTGQGAQAVALDLEQSDSIKACVQQVKSITPSLHALINNAAYAQPGSVLDLSMSALQKQFQTNVFGTIELTQLCLPLLEQGDDPRLVFLSSILGVVPSSFLGAYCASKYALEAFVSCLRMELNGQIKVTSIRPGAIETSFRKRAADELVKNIDIEASDNCQGYQRSVKEKTAEKSKKKRAHPNQVVSIVLRSLHSKKPKTAYYVTGPATLMGGLRRVIPERWVEALMRKFA